MHASNTRSNRHDCWHRVAEPEESAATEEGPSDGGAAAAQEQDAGDPCACPTGTCDKKYWSCPGNAGFKVLPHAPRSCKQPKIA